jgi:hypothetical protein
MSWDRDDRGAVRIEGIKDAARMLERLGVEAADFKPIWQELLEPMRREAVAVSPVSQRRKGQPAPGRYRRSIKVFKQKYVAGLYLRRNARMRYQRFVYFGSRGHRGKPYVRIFDTLLRKHAPELQRLAYERVDDLIYSLGLGKGWR